MDSRLYKFVSMVIDFLHSLDWTVIRLINMHIQLYLRDCNVCTLKIRMDKRMLAL